VATSAWFQGFLCGLARATLSDMNRETASLRRILVVDDDSGVRSALVRTLTSAGYAVTSVSEASEGLAHLILEPVDLVLSDHLMPNMLGLDFLKLVRTRYPDCLRILLTAYADVKTAIDAINHGEIYRFMLKPWDEDELLVTLHLAFEQVQLRSENRKLLTFLRQQPEMLERYEQQASAAQSWSLDAPGSQTSLAGPHDRDA
jgi:DNA-binding NtrC family response regulator